jgi:hypothetical protein
MTLSPVLIHSFLSQTALWDDPKTWTSVISAFAALAAMGVTYAWSKRHKEIDVTMHFQQAYDSLEMLKREVATREDSEHWFNRYWSLQARQYEYWLRGYIRDELYIYWMKCRRADYIDERAFFELKRPKLAEFQSNEPASPPYNYPEGWEKVKTNVIFTDHPYQFKEFMEEVLKRDTSKISNFVLGRKLKLLERLREWHP